MSQATSNSIPSDTQAVVTTSEQTPIKFKVCLFTYSVICVCDFIQISCQDIGGEETYFLIKKDTNFTKVYRIYEQVIKADRHTLQCVYLQA